MGKGQGQGMRPRDSQRQRVYDAENEVPGFRTEDRLDELSELNDWVLTVLASSWFKKHFPETKYIDVEDGRGRQKACGGLSGIKMPRWSRSKMITLHEIAHVVTLRQANKAGTSVPWHGREFAMAYLALVRHFLGQAKHDQLLEQFRLKKVKYKAKRTGPKRAISEKAIAALAAYRLRKEAANV